MEFDAALSLPAPWFLAQPDPSDPAQSVPAQVDAHLKNRRDLKPFRQVIIDAVNDYGSSCAAAGTLLSALRWDVTQDKRQDPLFAFLEVQRFDEDYATEPVDRRLERWRETAGRGQPDDEVHPETSIVDLKPGTAVRSQFVRPAGAEHVLRLVVEYYLLVDQSDNLFKLLFSTSNLAATAALVPEFDFIATRLELRPAA